jgi:CRP-like cAMP-binding protein
LRQNDQPQREEAQKAAMLLAIIQKQKMREKRLQSIQKALPSVYSNMFDTMVGLLKEVSYNEGTKIIVQGDIGDAFYIVEEGEVGILIQKDLNDSNEIPRQVAKIGAGTYFGVFSMSN